MNETIDFNNVLGQTISKQLIYIKFLKLKQNIGNGIFSKDWLLELTPELLSPLNDKYAQEFIEVDEILFRLHPYLRRFMSNKYDMNVDLIKFLSNLKLKSSNLSLGIALDPQWYSIDGNFSNIVSLEKGYGLDYDLPKIVKKILRDHKQIISVYYNPKIEKLEDLDENTITSTEKISVLEKQLSKDFRMPIRVLIRFEKEESISFNIYEFSNYFKGDFVVSRSIHAIYDYTSDKFIHIDGKALLFNVKNYDPDALVWLKIKRKRKRKLFRIDGKISNNYFVAITTLFFMGNDLILEFFNSDSVEQNVINNIESIENIT